MLCRKCGIELKENATICPRCNTPVEEVPQQEIPVIEFPQPVVEETPKKNKNILPIIIGLIGIIVIVTAVCMILFSNKEETDSVKNQKEIEEQAKKEEGINEDIESEYEEEKEETVSQAG